LLDTRTKKLEMDFVLEGDDRSMHVLNAVSPGWTCSIPFARHVVDRI
jgi:L-2-hydroxyglutarate oxidase LhgO